MKMYDYILAYGFQADGFLTTSTGTIQYSCKNKITTFEDVNIAIEFITKSLSDPKHNLKNVRNVAIYNMILLGRNNH